jgi:methoxymalonate biosynthesis protein
VIKCVVWDIDNTLLAGTYLESADRPPEPDAELLAVARELDGRGIVHALASRNPPAAAGYVATATGLPFAAAECGWGRKSEAVGRIIAELSIAADAVAFVDDDMMERAEVAAVLPDVLVLSPEDMAEALSWPQFSPAVITAEGRRRGEMYAQRRRRQEEARAFGGSRDDFLRYAETRVRIAPAGQSELPRLHELSVRTHQFNNAGEPVSEAELAAALGLEAGRPAGLQADSGRSRLSALGAEAGRLAAVRLRDRFGDDGVVGGALIDRAEAGAWSVPLLMMSCRALGRGVVDALLAWLCRQAAAAGAAQLRIPCLVTDKNVPLRLALAAAGFRPSGEAAVGQRAVFARPLAGELPGLPDWVVAEDLP